MNESKKKPYMAWWLLPFLFQEFNKDRPIRILMLGFHKPSKLGIPAKPDIVLIREPKIVESIPFPGEDLTRVLAGLIVCSANKNAFKEANIICNLTSKTPNIYREFDFHHMETEDVIRLCAKYGENWEVPIETSFSDIRLLKGAYSSSLRTGHNTNVHILTAVGKDIRHNKPVIYFKKSWNNFSDVMWLWDDGVRIIAGLMFLVRYPPKGSEITFLSDYELEVGIKHWVEELSSKEFVPVNQRSSVENTVEAIKL